MDFKETPSCELLDSLLVADFDRGQLFHKHRPRSMFSSDRIFNSWNARFSGAEALKSLDSNGYFCGRVLVGKYFRHRILWKMAHGYDPTEIDHINRDQKDNRIANLREVTRSENNINRSMSKFNSSGYIGIYRQNGVSGNYWVAQIKRDGKAVHLGRFSTVEEAVAARSGAEAVLRSKDR